MLVKDSSSRKKILIALALGVAALLVYSPALRAGFIWDDDRYVTHNPLLTASDGLQRIWFSLDAPSQYFPLTYTVLRLAHSLWGLQPAGYHFLNILLHVANAYLVWRLLARLKVPAAWLAAAIFALHPVQVESVAWISELKNLLMGFFFLLTLLAWVEHVGAGGECRRFFYFAALAFYFLALSAKSTACTLPAALVLILWLQKKPISKRALLEIVPFVVLALGVGLLAIWWEKYHQGTRVLVPLAPSERILIASRAIWFYLSKLFWPNELIFIYPQWKIEATRAGAYIWLALTFIAAAAIYFTRRSFGRAPEVAALFFVTTLGPVLGFIMLYTFRYTFVADHYQYLAMIGPVALISTGLFQLDRCFRRRGVLALGVAIPLLVCLGVLTWRQTLVYRDAEALWRTTIDRNPRCWMAYNNLGVLRFSKGEIPEAIRNYEQALQIHADYPEAHYNLGSALLQNGKVDDAIDHCERALQLQPGDPDAHVVLGNAFMGKQHIDEAIKQYEKALSLQPENADAHYNLGMALSKKGEEDRARREFDKARELESPR